MKKNRSFKLIVSIILFSILINSCKKEDNISDIQDVVEFDQNVKNLIDAIRADSLEKKVQWLENMETRYALSSNRKTVAKKIMDRFISYGFSNVRLDSFYVTLKSTNTLQYNVIATFDGSVSPNSIFVIGAHYDCIIGNNGAFSNTPGANDNASGVAATLEVARVLKQQGFTPKSTIEFVAFAAEEFGLYGSKDYALKASQKSKDIKLMLNNDMIAYWPKGNTNFSVNILDYANSSDNRRNAQQYCSLYTTLTSINDNTYQKYSDSYSFYLYNYKALFFTTNSDDPNYHTVNDLTSNCNFEICKEITKLNCAILADINK